MARSAGSLTLPNVALEYTPTIAEKLELLVGVGMMTCLSQTTPARPEMAAESEQHNDAHLVVRLPRSLKARVDVYVAGLKAQSPAVRISRADGVRRLLVRALDLPEGRIGVTEWGRAEAPSPPVCDHLVSQLLSP